MSELPCVGAGITVVDPGAEASIYDRGRFGFARRRRNKGSTAGRLLRAFVVETGTTWTKDLGSVMKWQSGKRIGEAWECDEGTTWVRGHGPQARGALLAQRALESQR